MFGLLAKLTAAAIKQSAKVIPIALVFMCLLIEKQIFDLIEAAVILVVCGKFSNSLAWPQVEVDECNGDFVTA